MKEAIPITAFNNVMSNSKHWWIITSLGYLIGTLFASIYLLNVTPLLFWLVIFVAGGLGIVISEKRKVV